MVNSFEVALMEGLLDKLETRNRLSGISDIVCVCTKFYNNKHYYRFESQ